MHNQNRTRPVAVRLTPAEFENLEANAQAADVTNISNAARTLIERGGELNLLTLSPEQFRSEADLIRQFRADVAAYKAVAGPVLRGYWVLGNEIHEEWILNELAAANPALVGVVARTAGSSSELNAELVKIHDDYFARNPGAEFFELARVDLTWLELHRGARPGIAQQHVSYVCAAVERAMIQERWYWHRRLLSELVASGIDYKTLFAWNETEKMWRLIERPKLRSFSQGGCLEWEIGEPPAAREQRRRTIKQPNVYQGARIGASAPELTAAATLFAQSAKIDGRK